MNFTFSDKRKSLTIAEQFPSFFYEYGPKFIKFVEKYYEWMETVRVEVSVEYLDDSFSDLEFNQELKKFEELSDSFKPIIKGLHTNTVGKILSFSKIDRNNYVFQVKLYPQNIEDNFEEVDYSYRTQTLKHLTINEISKGYSIDEEIVFLNDPYSSLSEIDCLGNQNHKIKIKSFIQQSEMSLKNFWNINDIDLTLNNMTSKFMGEYMIDFPQNFPNISESLDINDKINRNYTVEDFRRFLVKNSKDFYTSRGTEGSFRYLFRTVFNKEMQIYYPQEDLLKSSDNTYISLNSLHVSPVSEFDLETFNFKNNYIVGEYSGATALVYDYFLIDRNNKMTLQLFLETSTMLGKFVYNENLKFLNDNDEYQNLGNVNYSLIDVNVLEESTEKFKLGERFFLDRNFKRIGYHEISSDSKFEYIELEVEKLESGEIYDIEIVESGIGYNVGDEIIFDHSDTYIKSIPYRNIKAYVSEVDLCGYNSIKKIKIVCSGKGVISLPKIISIGKRKYDEKKRHNAKLKLLSRNVGKAKSIRIVNSGINYNFNKKKVDLNNDSVNDLELFFGTTFEKSFSFSNNNGFLSDTKVLQDSDYYQNFSYIIRTDVSPKDYRSLVDELVHPAGTRFFSEYLIVNKVDAKIKVNRRKLNEIEINDRNYIGKYDNVVLEEWDLYNNFDSVEIRQNDLIPTIIRNSTDYKFKKLDGNVKLIKNSDVVIGTQTKFTTSLIQGDFVMIQNQGFYVVAINNDSEMIVSQESNETLTSENILIRTVNIDTAG